MRNKFFAAAAVVAVFSSGLPAVAAQSGNDYAEWLATTRAAEGMFAVKDTSDFVMFLDRTSIECTADWICGMAFERGDHRMLVHVRVDYLVFCPSKVAVRKEGQKFVTFAPTSVLAQVCDANKPGKGA